MSMRWRLYLLIFCITFISGCITDSSSDSDDIGNDEETGISAEEYILLKTGATYTYRETLICNGEYDDWEQEWIFDDPITYDVSMTVGSQTEEAGNTYIKVNTEKPFIDSYYGILDEKIDTPSYVRIADNTLYSYEYIPTLEGEYFHGHWIDVPQLTFNNSIWLIHADSQLNGADYVQVLWTGRYVGYESVTVPAGLFQDCLVFELTRHYERSYWRLSRINENQITKTTLWYAAGIGMVKSEVIMDDKYEGREITTTELTSYSIP